MNTTESPAKLQTATRATAANEVTAFGANDADEDVFADPFILIEAESRRIRFDLKQLWVYRELLHFLVWRDIKIRYKQTLLGSSWAIIQPLFAMLLFTLIFG